MTELEKLDEFLAIEDFIESDEFKEFVKNEVVWEIYDPRPAGGQHCGVVSRITLRCDVLNCSISFNPYRSQLKNRLAMIEMVAPHVMKHLKIN